MALTAQRRLQNLIDGLMLPLSHKCKANKVFYKGAAVGFDSGGYLVPMAGGTPGLRFAGCVDTGQAASVDTTGQSDGDTELKVEVAIWGFINGTGGDAIGQSEMYKPVFFIDDQTVGKTDGGVGRPVAGSVCRIEGGLVFVCGGFPYVGAENAGAPVLGGTASNAVASGALGLTPFTRITVDGTKAYTLANGTFVGQRKCVRVTAATNTPVGTLTPASASGFTAISALDAVGDQAELEWNGTAWEVVSSTGVTVS